MISNNGDTQHQGSLGAPGPYQDDEIDLVDIVRILIRQRKLIVSVALLVLFASAAYAFVSPSIYKVEAFVLPPSAKDISGLSLLPSFIHEEADEEDEMNSEDIYTPQNVFEETVRNLNLNSLQRQFLS